MYANLTRIGDGPNITNDDVAGHGSNFSCEFYENGRDSAPVRRNFEANTEASSSEISRTHTHPCPFHRIQKSTDFDLATNKNIVKDHTSEFEYCYVMNMLMDYRIKWRLHSLSQSLRIEISANNLEGNSWVGIGFRPLSRVVDADYSLDAMGTGHHNEFGMIGADIVLASLKHGVRQAYATIYTGPPEVDDSLEISDVRVSNDNGRITLAFTRPLVSGYLSKHYNFNASIATGYADLLWAVGEDSDDGDLNIAYHYSQRGMRLINWMDPTIALKDVWKCDV
jgi:hypothetical protein